MPQTPYERGRVFPIVEIFGYPHDCATPEAAASRQKKWCPFSATPCEKEKQYGFGYCSVTYSAAWDKQGQNYAVCDHRLDGQPTAWAVRDYFGDKHAYLVPEVAVTQTPRLNLDYVAYSNDSQAPGGVRAIAIETQAIDLRGGGVRPAWDAWAAGEPGMWRSYYTKDAALKGRKDTVDYGINTGNVYKRLGTQVAVKGEYLKQIEVPLYVVMQQKILQQLRARIDFVPVADDEEWDITFIGFDYDGTSYVDGQLAMPPIETVRTSLENYTLAMTSSASSVALRKDFIAKVKRKAASQVRQRTSTEDSLF
ncbi:hypothetical protein [Streptomyces sp. NPDC094049]|uniref:hypothetical protein n=1 Tax=Streptomyces sp. NPDC094049 TaxID=3154987 RepID=UPI0033164D3F